VASIPKTDLDETKVTKLLKLDKQIEKNSEQKKLESQKRMEGESKRAYAKRTRAETREMIKQTTTRKNPEKLQRKKEFLKNKKNKKKKRNAAAAFQDDEDYGDDEKYYGDNSDTAFVTGERAVAATKADPVRFGEQAERPPVFRQLPRGANSSSSSRAKAQSQSKKSQGMSEAQIEAEKDAMEIMRRRVQAQYAAIRSKRRQAGDGFHL